MDKQYKPLRNPVYIHVPLILTELKTMVKLVSFHHWALADGIVLVSKQSIMNQKEIIRFVRSEGRIIADRWPPNDCINDLVMNVDSMEILKLYADDNGLIVCPFVYPHNIAKIEFTNA